MSNTPYRFYLQQENWTLPFRLAALAGTKMAIPVTREMVDAGYAKIAALTSYVSWLPAEDVKQGLALTFQVMYDVMIEQQRAEQVSRMQPPFNPFGRRY